MKCNISYVQFYHITTPPPPFLGKLSLEKVEAKRWEESKEIVWVKINSREQERKRKKLFCVLLMSLLFVLNHVTIFDCHIFRHHCIVIQCIPLCRAPHISECEWKSPIYIWLKRVHTSQFSFDCCHSPLIPLSLSLQINSTSSILLSATAAD